MIQTEQAIHAALRGNWTEAVSLNLEIIKENAKDIEAYNRLAFAYTAQGQLTEARETYQKVIDIDSYNPIALKNLKRLSETTAKKGSPATNFHIDNRMFLEEVGKTKVITLVNTATPKILRSLQVGHPLSLSIKRLKIFVIDEHEEFIGMLPDNISKRLIKFLDGGNKYTAHVKSVEDKNITIFMKETKRATKFKNQPSFVLSDLPKQAFSLPHKKKHYESEAEEEPTED